MDLPKSDKNLNEPDELQRLREDVYPQRWESAKGTSGYSPACGNEWKPDICHKPKIRQHAILESCLHPQQKPREWHHLDGAESHGDAIIGAQGDDDPLRHRQFNHGFGEGTHLALLDAGFGQGGTEKWIIIVNVPSLIVKVSI